MHLPLCSLLQHARLILLRQPSSDGSGLLGSKVKGEVLLVLVEKAELCALVGVDNCENLGD